jgi:uncharacterized membrane protein YgdD (TMEM256/DUF423 family)
MPRAPAALAAFAAFAALMGAGGVALAALAVHADGGELAKTASLFLVLHAAALVGLSAHARFAEGSTRLLTVGAALAAGATLLSADLAARAFLGGRLFPFAAPIGGSLTILSWLALAIVFALRAAKRAST